MGMMKKIPRLKVAFSINTLNEVFRGDMDNACSIDRRINAMKELYRTGIHTVLFMSPIFPYITEWKEMIDLTQDFVKEYWFENLNLRGSYKKEILGCIHAHYPTLLSEYERIYLQNDTAYWRELAVEMDEYCRKLGVEYTNYFYHEKLVKKVNRGNKIKLLRNGHNYGTI